MNTIILSTIFICLFSIVSYTQSIDSIFIIPSNPTENDTIKVHIYGTNPSTGEYISKINDSINTNEINLYLYFIHCAGWTIMTPYDTLITIGTLPTGNYSLHCETITDTNITDTINCFDDYLPPLTIDSTDTSFSVLVTAINEGQNIERGKVLIYPNPSCNLIIIEFENRVKVKHTLTLHNTTGQLVQKIDDITTENIKIEIQNLTNGLYFYQIRNDKEIVGNGKLIVE